MKHKVNKDINIRFNTDIIRIERLYRRSVINNIRSFDSHVRYERLSIIDGKSTIVRNRCVYSFTSRGVESIWCISGKQCRELFRSSLINGLHKASW